MKIIHNEIIIFGAHYDDIELGTGGLIARYGNEPDINITLVIATNASEERRLEQIASFNYMKEKYCAVKRIIYLDYITQTLSENFNKLRNQIEDLLYRERPGTQYSCFVHYPVDTHVDHRILSNAVTDAARELTVIYYESPSTYDFKTNLYVNMTEEHLKEKIKLAEFHKSQMEKNNRLFIDKILSQAAYHAMNTYERYAEGYHIHKQKI